MIWLILPIFVNGAMSMIAGWASYYFMLQFMPIFIQRNLYGLDQCKLKLMVEKKPIPEPIGVIAAAIYLISMFAFIPLPFYELIYQRAIFAGLKGLPDIECESSIYLNLMSILAGIVSICTAVLLGFADDILDLRWRHKIIFPTLSSLPLLLVYIISRNPTAVLLPKFLQNYFGDSTYLDIGPFFYLYMTALVVFCTNAINIIAGINGVEVGQSLVIAASIAIFNTIQVRAADSGQTWHHVLSLFFILPFIGTSLALFLLNKYPARVFVGDTYCYWAGMTIAVCALTGRFSKTLMLFLLPQVFNFLYSCPQLFHLIPCPRHRLPSLNKDSGRLEISVVEFQPERLTILGKICFKLLNKLRLVNIEKNTKDDECWIKMNNLTILNLILKFTGPLFEWELTNRMMSIQTMSSIFAFVCRFYFAKLLYEEVN